MPDGIRPLSRRDAAAAARLHCGGIRTGFLSTLGEGFLRQLYAAIPSCQSGFGFIWMGPNGSPLGFVACAEGTGRLYRQVLLRRGLLMALALARHAVHPKTLKRLWETLRYPSVAGSGLPPAEVLSIAVAEGARGRGGGTALMGAALDEFRRRGVNRVKVAVGADNAAAGCFYERCGFHLAARRQHHGQPMNIYVVALSGTAAPGPP